MAFDAFLKLKDIPGESTDDKHKDWIEILSYSWGVNQQAAQSSAVGGPTSGKATFSDLSVVKLLDKASPKLMLHCASGKAIPEVILEFCKAGGDKQKYLELKLTNCIVSSYRPGGSAQGSESIPLEEISLNFLKMEMTYNQMDEKGASKGSVPAHWDLGTNKGG
jgi:type VI secretion system secreted protein Hcp